MKTPIVELSDINFAYNGEVVLQDVSLTIREGDFIAMIGPNGGGKTTLLKVILGLLKPNRGLVRVSGQPARKASAIIGYVPQ
ncbi:MAG: ATP-binding cassette domain-containing protein, partial [Desulfosarcinaceae bacterium]